MKKLIALLLVINSNFFIYASTPKYTINICSTLILENALDCKKKILEKNQKDVFIVKDQTGTYFTYLGIYGDENSAKYALISISNILKEQKAFIKILPDAITINKSKNEEFIDLSNSAVEIKQEKKTTKKALELVSPKPKIDELELVSSYPYKEGQKLDEEDESQNTQDDKYREDNSQNIYTQAELKYIEEIKRISMEEFDEAYKEESTPSTHVESTPTPESIPVEPKQKITIIKPQIHEKVEKSYKKSEEPSYEKPALIKKEEVNIASLLNPSSYEQIVIEIDSITNTMIVKAKINNHFEVIKKYRVSTAKKDIEKPFGDGKITQITLNPTWYPTTDTINSFKKRGIILPSVVPPGSKFNYMGSAKINLTHEVNGKTTFRIHGTLDERTIGTNESAGCIRMKNAQVVELATLLKEFSHSRSLNDVTVVLK